MKAQVPTIGPQNIVEVFVCDVQEYMQTVISANTKANTKALFIHTYILINKSIKISTAKHFFLLRHTATVLLVC